MIKSSGVSRGQVAGPPASTSALSEPASAHEIGSAVFRDVKVLTAYRYRVWIILCKNQGDIYTVSTRRRVDAPRKTGAYLALLREQHESNSPPKARRTRPSRYV